jgi:hypothetical protein
MIHKPEAQARGKPGILAVRPIACASGLCFEAKPIGGQGTGKTHDGGLGCGGDAPLYDYSLRREQKSE